MIPETYTTPVPLILRDKELGKTFMSHLYYPTYSRFAPLLFGVLLAYSEVFYRERIKEFINNHRKMTYTVYLTSIIVFIAMLNFPSYISGALYYKYFNVYLNLFLIVTHRYIFSLALFLILIIIFNFRCKSCDIINGFFSHRFWEPFSILTFPMYLFHFPFVGAAAAIVFGTVNPKNVESASLTNVFSIFILSVILTFLFSALMHITVEKPFIVYGRKRLKRGSDAELIGKGIS